MRGSRHSRLHHLADHTGLDRSAVFIALWFVATLAFLVLAWAAFTKQPWTARALLLTATASGVLCALSLPGARIGLAINLALIVWLAVTAPARKLSER
ncbi:MAG: hypothetical protein WCF04_11130 [Candidatus Nanopelagicales bacterium]